MNIREEEGSDEKGREMTEKDGNSGENDCECTARENNVNVLVCTRVKRDVCVCLCKNSQCCVWSEQVSKQYNTKTLCFYIQYILKK